jgi:hypothetical protein
MTHNLTVGQQDQHWSQMSAVLETLHANDTENRCDELLAGWHSCQRNKG